MRRLVVDHDRSAADGNRETQARLDVVGEVAEQQRRGEPGCEGRRVVGDEPSVDERERRPQEPDERRRGEPEAVARKQQQGDRGKRRDGEPPSRLRHVGGVARERNRERALERRDQDQGVEAVSTRERPEPAHGRERTPAARRPRPT